MFTWIKKLFLNSTIRKNIKQMTGVKEGQMLDSLKDESTGNVGTHEGKTCLGINFWFDDNTGEIKRFTNDTKPNEYKNGQFKIIMGNLTNFEEFLKNPIARKYPEIVKIYYSQGASTKAKQIIALSVEIYNQLGKKMVNQRKL